MFWKHNNQFAGPNVRHFEELLNNVDVTLQDLMDEEDILQECKAQNKKLMEFLARPEIMDELVTLTTVEPSADLDEKARYKYPNIACELLTSDVPTLNERLAKDTTLLGKLYNFIESDPPLNPLLASFFSKTLSMLVSQKTEQDWYSYQVTFLQILEFLKTKENFVPLLLKHLGTSAIMDLMLKLITNIEGVDMRNNILNWLDSQRVVQSLVVLLNPSVETNRQCNAAQLLSDIIEKSRDNQQNSTERVDPDPIVTAIESPETVSLLLDNILGPDRTESSVVGGVQVLLSLLDFKRNLYGDTTQGQENHIEKEHTQKVIESTTMTILTRLKDLHNILIDPPKKVPVMTTVGTLDPPFGNTRLQVTKLLAALIATNNIEFRKELANLGTVDLLLDLFFKYTWNNFLHTQVQQCIAFALNSTLEKNDVSEESENVMHSHLILKCRLIGRILEAWDDNEQKQLHTKGVRRGYMGHLINIANTIVNKSANTSLGNFIKENVSKETLTAWENFVSGPLTEVNKVHETILGGVHPNQSNSGNNQDDFRAMPFIPSSTVHQQVFAEYQVQPIATQFAGTYGYQDDDFNDDNALHTSIDRLTNMTFDMNVGDLDLDRHSKLFQHVCSLTISTLDDMEDDIWEDRDQDTTFQTVIDKRAGDWNTHSSGSDEDDQPVAKMEVDSTDPWTMNSETVVENTVAPISSVDPWSTFEQNNTVAPSPQQEGWADFESVPFTNFETNFDKAPTTPFKIDGSVTPDNQESSPLAAQEAENALIAESHSIREENPVEISQSYPATSSKNEDSISKTDFADIKSDTNANLGNEEDAQNKDDDLIDNYAFLTSQGLMGSTEEKRSTPQETSVEQKSNDIETVNEMPKVEPSESIIVQDNSQVPPPSTSNEPV